MDVQFADTSTMALDFSETDPPSSVLPRSKRVPSHSLSSASSDNSASSRKGRHAEPGTTEAHSEQASISTPPPSARPIIKSRPSSTFSHRRPSETSEYWAGGSSSPRPESAIEDLETPKLTAGSTAENSKHLSLPEAALQPRSSVAEPDTKRMSTSSIYSLSSARAGGGHSSTASANGSEAGTRPTTGNMPPSKALGISQPETSTSALSVTTSSAPQYTSQVSPSSHQLTTRDLMMADGHRRSAASRGENMTRSNVPRSRSRAQRRISGSTAPSSHSPSSERGMLSSRDRDEAKPAPWGIIGVCALDVKARSKPSRNILNRLIAKGEFEVIVFGDKVILDEDIENWPVCDFLISFYSDGFPLEKAIAYVKARKPFCVNDVPMQKILWDRRICLRILDKINVPTPRRLEVNRDGGPSILTPELARHLKETTGVVLAGPEDGTGGQTTPPRVVELLDDGDTLSVDGTLLRKPFVEKPTNGEDHNICIYYPKSQGGGARKLFRKIGNKSSEWVEGLTIPRAILEPENSYIYEQFMNVDNFEDVKAYTVGPNFCHAETRKSPVVDGLVRRNTHGKEIRYITPLTKEESAMAARIATSFGQRVCGFDLLRADGKSYVIDVNGWSFVKDNEEYYIQCSNILREMFIREKQIRDGFLAPDSSVASPESSEADTAAPTQKETSKEHHRSALQSLLSRSPSISKLSNLHHSKKSSHGNASPDLSAFTTPLSSPPSVDRSSWALPSMQTTPALPPPADSSSSSMPPTIPANLIATVAESAFPTLPPPAAKHAWKLKGMVSVIRHADRTPKQKYKFTFHTEPFIELLKGHQEEVLLTGTSALNSVIAAVNKALREGIEDRTKLRILGNVLAKKGSWMGTKVQIKPMFRKRKPDDFPDKAVPHIANIPVDLTKVIPSASPLTAEEDTNKDINLMRSPTRADSLTGVTLSRITAAEESLVLDKLQLIVKWGGEPTHSARYQSQELGENMRNDLLLMNKEVLDEVHVFSSSERRVTTSAQIWAASFLDDNDLPSDFITVRKDLLDDSNAAKDEMDRVKKKLKVLLRAGHEPPPQFVWPTNLPEPSVIMRELVQLMNFHRRVMRHNYGKLFGSASSSLNAIANPGDKNSGSLSTSSSSMSQATATNSIQARWCCGEDAELFRERWEKLFSEFCDVEKVDPSKISELYDTMKFDALHNRQFLEWVFTPSKSILDEDDAVTRESEDGIHDRQEAKPSDNGKVDKSKTLPLEKSESTRNSVSGRLFRRRSMMNYLKAGNEETPPEQYFHLFKGSSETRAKIDTRLEKLRQLYKLAKVLFDFICPQEYGMTDHEKLEIGLLTSLPLLKEVVEDLEEMQASDIAKSFFYFTKESHIYTLLNCILEGGIETKIKRSDIPELDYLSQICFELYESETTPPKAVDDFGNEDYGKGEQTFEYSIRVTISPGCHTYDPLDVQLDSKHCIGCAPRRSLTPHGDWKLVIETLRAKFHQVNLPKSFLAVNLSESHTFHKRDNLEEGGQQGGELGQDVEVPIQEGMHIDQEGMGEGVPDISTNIQDRPS